MGLRQNVVDACYSWSKQKKPYWNGYTGYGCSDSARGVLADAGVFTEAQRNDSNALWAAQGKTEGLDDPTKFQKLPANTKLIPSDIIVYLWHHVAINIEDGVKIFEAAPHLNSKGEVSHPLSDDGGEVGIYSGHSYNCAGVPVTAVYRIIEKEGDIVATKEQIEKAVQHGIDIANNNTYGYSNQVGSNLGHDFGQNNFDCGAFVSDCYRYAGILPSGTVFEPNTYTGTAWSYNDILTAAGFVKYAYNASTVKRGDILIKDGRHTEMAIGNGQQVGAHSDKDGRSGDSSGNEISVVSLYTNYWDYMYRLPVGEESGSDELPTLQYGSTGIYVKKLQQILNEKSNSGLAVDGSFGPATLAAVKAYQTSVGIYSDGIVGAKTWAKLTEPSETVTEDPIVVAIRRLEAAIKVCNDEYGRGAARKTKLIAAYGSEAEATKIQELVNSACK